MLGFRKKPVTAKDFRKLLKQLGFRKIQGKGGHEHWVNDCFRGEPRKVTVSAHNEPFDGDVRKSMISQAGLSQREFFKMLESKHEVKKLLESLEPT